MGTDTTTIEARYIAIFGFIVLLENELDVLLREGFVSTRAYLYIKSEVLPQVTFTNLKEEELNTVLKVMQESADDIQKKYKAITDNITEMSKKFDSDEEISDEEKLKTKELINEEFRKSQAELDKLIEEQNMIGFSSMSENNVLNLIDDNLTNISNAAKQISGKKNVGIEKAYDIIQYVEDIQLIKYSNTEEAPSTEEA